MVVQSGKITAERIAQGHAVRRHRQGRRPVGGRPAHDLDHRRSSCWAAWSPLAWTALAARLIRLLILCRKPLARGSSGPMEAVGRSTSARPSTPSSRLATRRPTSRRPSRPSGRRTIHEPRRSPRSTTSRPTRRPRSSTGSRAKSEFATSGSDSSEGSSGPRVGSARPGRSTRGRAGSEGRVALVRRRRHGFAPAGPGDGPRRG